MTSRALFVFVEIEGIPVVAGKLDIESTPTGKIGSFVYAKSYLSRQDAFPLDPLNLALEERLFQTTQPNYIFGVFNDAAPDLWGKKVIESLYPEPAPDDRKYLLFGSGQGVGALMFATSLDLKESPTLPSEKRLENLAKMQQGAMLINRKEDLPETLKKYLQGGISMGGHRPKTVIEYQGKQWLVKFSNKEDLYDHPKAEFAALQMARALGMDTPNHIITETKRGSALLTERFDRSGTQRLHYISAYALLNRQMSEPDLQRYWSYPALADLIGKLSSSPQEDRTELYKRMVFNIAIGNSDDHPRNYGFLKNAKDHLYRLCPFFDVMTQEKTALEMVQAMTVGDYGAASTFENALSQAGRFGLTHSQARAIVDKTIEVVSQRYDYYERAGLSAKDIDKIEMRVKLRLGERDRVEEFLSKPHLEIKPADLANGNYRGKIIAIDSWRIIQQIGKNRAIQHNVACFDSIPKKGQPVKIHYQNGIAQIEKLSERKKQGKEKDHGLER